MMFFCFFEKKTVLVKKERQVKRFSPGVCKKSNSTCKFYMRGMERRERGEERGRRGRVRLVRERGEGRKESVGNKSEREE
jgi:hypothetical protein